MKTNILRGALIILLSAALIGCGSDDRPPNPGTPEPAPHAGTFSGKAGTLSFAGDGKTVKVTLNDKYAAILGNAPNGGEYTYAFSWYNRGQCRYDVATRLYLSHQETNTINLHNKALSARFQKTYSLIWQDT